MFPPLAGYLRAQGWNLRHVLQWGTPRGLLWLVFRPEDRFPSVVAKLSRSADTSNVIWLEATALETLAGLATELHIPKILFRATLPEGGFLLVRSGLPGHPLRSELSPSDRISFSAQLQMIEPWLEAFQALVPHTGSAADWLAQAILLCKDQLVDPSREEEQLLATGMGCATELRDVPGIAAHGDLWAGNALEHCNQISVEDWADFHYGGPTEDLHAFLAGAVYARRATPAESADTLWKLFFSDCAAATLGKAATLRCLQRWNLGMEKLRPLFLLFLITHLTRACRSNHLAWRSLARRYVAAGMPRPFDS